jgi:ubiquitin carboxyl-terminal hydrolase 10
MRRRKPAPQSASVPVELPHRDGLLADNEHPLEEAQSHLEDEIPQEDPATVATSIETSLTSRASSADDSTRPTTPLSAVVHPLHASRLLKNIKTPSRAPGLPLSIIPAIPNIPFVPKVAKRISVGFVSQPKKSLEPLNGDNLPVPRENSPQSEVQDSAETQKPCTASPPAQKIAPKSWADLVRTRVQTSPKASEEFDGNGTIQANGFTTSKPDSLFQALSSYRVDELNESSRISFLEPRGLVNTGNMCYMNSVSRSVPLSLEFV